MQTSDLISLQVPNRNLNYESFKEAVLFRLSKDIPAPSSITVRKVPKNNGICFDGLVILENGVNIAPTLYLNHFYQSFRETGDFQAVYLQILDNYEKNKTGQHIDAGFFTDFARIRDRIVIKLIHREKNMGLLAEQVPHIPFLDLAIVFSCMFPVDLDIGSATIQIENSHLALWDLTAEDLFPIAVKNTVQLLPPKLCSISQVLGELLGAPAYPSVPEPSDPLFPMYVLTNEQNLFGAACIAYSGQIRSISDRFASDLYILPSSIHEVILVPAGANDRMKEFSNMVREVNETQVAPEDILSDHAYYYSRDRDEIIF